MVRKGEGFIFGNITLLLFVVFFLDWIYLHFFRTSDTSLQVQLFSGFYCLIALTGGISGLIISKKWGGFKSVLGKAISFLSLGMLAQVFGQVAYSIIFITKKEIPYPSIGDLGYIGSMFFYSTGLIYLGKSMGVVHILKNLKHKMYYLIIPTVLLFVSYWLFLKDYVFDWTTPLKVFLDFGYPLGDTIYIAIALVIYFMSKGLLGGLMKPKILLLLFALFFQFVADYGYLLASNYFTVKPAGWNELLYVFAYYFMSIALIEMLNVYHEIKQL